MVQSCNKDEEGNYHFELKQEKTLKFNAGWVAGDVKLTFPKTFTVSFSDGEGKSKGGEITAQKIATFDPPITSNSRKGKQSINSLATDHYTPKATRQDKFTLAIESGGSQERLGSENFLSYFKSMDWET
jgi:hypothetical protein